MDNQILDYGETAEVNSAYDSTSETKSTKKITTFYFVKHHPYEDIELENKIENANLEIRKKNEEIGRYDKDLKQYREDQQHANWELGCITSYRNHYKSLIDFKKEYLFHVRNALDTKCTYNTVAMQSPEVKELTKHISWLKHVVKRERLTQREEKELIKEIKDFEEEKDEAVSLASFNNKKEQDKVVQECELRLCNYKKIPKEKWQQALTEEIDELKAKQINDRKRMRYLKHHLKDVDKLITCLVPKLDAATSERNRSIELRRKSIELAKKLNACYYESRGLIDSAKQLAAMKDKADLAELSNHELENFFSQWSGNEIFRKEYNRRILWSLESRGLSRDGRIKNPDESPIVPEGLIPWYFQSSTENLTDSLKETRGMNLLDQLFTQILG